MHISLTYRVQPFLVYPGSVTGATRRCYCWFSPLSHRDREKTLFLCGERLSQEINFALRLGGPFNIEVSRRLLSMTSLLSGAMFNAYSSSSLPFWFWLIIPLVHTAAHRDGVLRLSHLCKLLHAPKIEFQGCCLTKHAAPCKKQEWVVNAIACLRLYPAGRVPLQTQLTANAWSSIDTDMI